MIIYLYLMIIHKDLLHYYQFVDHTQQSTSMIEKNTYHELNKKDHT